MSSKKSSSSKDLNSYYKAESNFYKDLGKYQPITYTPDLDLLQTIARKNAEANAYASKALEEQITPELAKTRVALNQQVLNDLEGGGQLDTAARNDLVRTGVMQAINSGVGTAPGSLGAGNVASNLIRAITANRDKNQGKAQSLLNENPQPISGIDPGDLVSIKTGADQQTVNDKNNFTQQGLAFRQNSLLNRFNAIQQQQALKAAQANNRSSNISSLLGAGLGAATGIGGLLLKR